MQEAMQEDLLWLLKKLDWDKHKQLNLEAKRQAMEEDKRKAEEDAQKANNELKTLKEEKEAIKGGTHLAIGIKRKKDADIAAAQKKDWSCSQQSYHP
jgi:hypothetical protein